MKAKKVTDLAVENERNEQENCRPKVVNLTEDEPEVVNLTDDESRFWCKK